MNIRYLPIFIVFYALLVGSLGQQLTNEQTCSNRVRSCDPTINYFAEREVVFEYAQTVKSLNYTNTYVTIEFEWTDYTSPLPQQLNYVLVRCGCPSPALGAGWGEFFVPASSAVVQQTTTIPKITSIGPLGWISALETSCYVSEASVLAAVADSTIVNLNYNYTLLADTAYFAQIPDVIVTQPSGEISIFDSTTYQSMPNPTWYNSSLVTVFNARRFGDVDAGETSPLGRAELMKVYGILFGAETTANLVFGAIADRYKATMLIAKAATRRPSVMLGVPFGPSWTVTAGSSYMGQFVNDANAEYFNAGDVLPTYLPTEQYVKVFGQAQFWLNAAYTDNVNGTMQGLITGNYTGSPGGDQSVFPQFLGFSCNNVYANDKQYNQYGNDGDSFFELGVVRPDIILRDLVQILHPDQFDIEDLYFYRKLLPLSSAQIGALQPPMPTCPMLFLPYYPPRGQGQAYLTRYFLVKNYSAALFDNDLYSTIKPSIATSLGKDTADFELFVSNTEFQELNFQVGAVIVAKASSYNSEARQLASKAIGHAFVKAVNHASNHTAIASASSNTVFVSLEDFKTFIWTDNPPLTHGEIAAIVICGLLGLVLLLVFLGLVSKFSYHCGKISAYESLESPTDGTSQRDSK